MSTKQIVLDACTLINLVNGQVLREVLSLDGNLYFIGQLVLDEAASISDILAIELARGRLHKLDAADVSASAFLAIVEQHNLGNGEAECIAFASAKGAMVGTDDGYARKVVVATLGASRLTGTIGLMRDCIRVGCLTLEDTRAAYDLMRARGGFLPEVDWHHVLRTPPRLDS